MEINNKYISIELFRTKELKLNIELNIELKLFRTFHQCAYKNLINFLLKTQNLKNRLTFD